MQQSMTGYGRGEHISHLFCIKSEIKSLNSKFFDFSSRIPSGFTCKEQEIKKLISQKLVRGKVLFTLEIEIIDKKTNTLDINEEVIEENFQKLKNLSSRLGIFENTDLFRLAFEYSKATKNENICFETIPWEDVLIAIENSINECIKYRIREGVAVVEAMKKYINHIEIGSKKIEKKDPDRILKKREKLKRNIEELKNNMTIDNNRFEQEILYYLEHLDISEEKVRLSHHIDFFKNIISSEANCGKKLGFISQEIGREINTIGSKANDVEIQHEVVCMKENLEKIKEQILNIV